MPFTSGVAVAAAMLRVLERVSRKASSFDWDTAGLLLEKGRARTDDVRPPINMREHMYFMRHWILIVQFTNHSALPLWV
jgi:hypothetical protein